jgi:hypothetical protein
MRVKIDEELRPFFDLLGRKGIPNDQIDRVRNLIVERYQSGQTKKYVVVGIDVILIALIVIVIGPANILDLKLDKRTALINGFLAFHLAVAAFIPSLKLSQISAGEISGLIGGQEIPQVDMAPVQKFVEQDISRYLTFISACGVFATVMLEILS